MAEDCVDDCHVAKHIQVGAISNWADLVRDTHEGCGGDKIHREDRVINVSSRSGKEQ